MTDKPSNRYLTVGPPIDILNSYWIDGADLDPFHDPERAGQLARFTFDLRKGEDAYALDWSEAGDGNIASAWVNGGYSGTNPVNTAIACARARRQGIEIMNLCPAAPGSVYWKRYVWPYANVMIWCGRLPFQAAIDILDDKGEIRVKKGEIAKGNRTEISLVGLVDEPERLLELGKMLGGYPGQLL